MFCIKLAVLLSAVSIAASMMLAQYTDCGSQGQIHSFSLDPCNQEPCHIFRNQKYVGHINFTSQVKSHTLTNELHGIFATVPLKWTIEPINGCGNGIHCPLQPGLAQVITATVVTPQVSEYKGRMVGKWEMKDENNRNVLCLAFGLFFNV